MRDASLHELQARFHALSTTCARSVDDPSDIIVGDETRSAAERLAVYARMYIDRLTDALAEDFPAVRAVLGADEFCALVERYLPSHPPRNPSIRFVGDRFAEFLRTATERAWLAELARLETALLDVFDAADATPLTFDDVRMLAPDALGALRIETIPASRLVSVDYAIDDVWRAVHEEHAFADPPENPRTILAWRQDITVRHRTLDSIESDALANAKEGTSFAAICDRLGEDRSIEDAAKLATELLGRWVADGLLNAVSR
jgi:hypothetical protein